MAALLNSLRAIGMTGGLHLLLSPNSSPPSCSSYQLTEHQAAKQTMPETTTSTPKEEEEVCEEQARPIGSLPL